MGTRRITAALLGALLLAGCATGAPQSTGGSGRATTRSAPSASSPGPSTAAAPSQSPSSTPTSFSLTANVKDGATNVPVDTLLTVNAPSGTVTEVKVDSSASGKNSVPVTGTIVGDRWTARSRLDPSSRYTLTATAKGPDGSTKTLTTSFTTAAVSRSNEVFPTLTPVLGGPFGVAQPIVIQFDVPVKNKTEFEKNLHVTSTPAQEGSWGWIDDKTVHYRPKEHWKPGTKIHLDANLNGVNAGGGNYGQLNRTLDLVIGKKQSGHVDLAKHTITWTTPGKVPMTFPMSAGKPGFVTRSGTKVVMEKAENITMASETTGIPQDDPEGYNVKVAFALRVTGSGEFIHSAPWNSGSFGRRNSSHGCVGLGEEQMYRLYETVQIGDPVTFVGSDRTLEDGNGWSMWNISWEQWKKKSALR